MFTPPGTNEFKWQLSNFSTTRPAAAMGNLIVAGATGNTMGTWNTIFSGSQVTNDIYGIALTFNNSAGISAAVRNSLFDIGIDHAGGTAFTVEIPYLLAGHAAPYNLTGGIFYYFPLLIPKGSSIGCRAQSSVASSNTSLAVTVFGAPTRPDTLYVGSKVFTFGVDVANSRGNVATLGTTADGANTLLRPNTVVDMPLSFWQIGYAAVDTTMSALAITVDLTAGQTPPQNKKLIINNALFLTTAAEQISNIPIFNSFSTVLPQSNIYIRGQCSGTADTSTNFTAYGLG
jgi:hypothetical protein